MFVACGLLVVVCLLFVVSVLLFVCCLSLLFLFVDCCVFVVF